MNCSVCFKNIDEYNSAICNKCKKGICIKDYKIIKEQGCICNTCSKSESKKDVIMTESKKDVIMTESKKDVIMTESKKDLMMTESKKDVYLTFEEICSNIIKNQDKNQNQFVDIGLINSKDLKKILDFNYEVVSKDGKRLLLINNSLKYENYIDFIENDRVLIKIPMK